MIRNLIMAAALGAALASTAHADTPQAGDEAAVLSWLRQELGTGAEPGEAPPKVALAWADLNGDGRAEAIVYVVGRRWCGSGGCKLLIGEINAQGVEPRASMTITQPPIAVLHTRTQGYRDLSVGVCGGGVTRCYRAQMRFDRGYYLSNPSVAARLQAGAREDIVLPDAPPTRSIADTEKHLSDFPPLRGLRAPLEIKLFVDRRMGCAHWSGEEGYDRDRTREILRALRQLRCEKLDADEARLRKRHAQDLHALKALDDTRDWMW